MTDPLFLLPEQMSSLEMYCVHLLAEKGWTMATAESCTGGAIAAKLCTVSGASNVFLGSVVAYGDSIKEKVLAVPREVIERNDVVSEQVTESMAENVRSLFGSDVSIAVSGYFGPTGGSKDVPLGTVCATLLLKEESFSKTFFFQGTRESICAQTVETILRFLCGLLRRL